MEKGRLTSGDIAKPSFVNLTSFISCANMDRLSVNRKANYDFAAFSYTKKT